MKGNEYREIYYIYMFILIIGLWQMIGMLVHNPIFPPIWDISINIFENFHKKLGIHLLWSLRRIVLGILFAVTLGVPLGIFTGYFKKVDLFFSPILYFTYPVPKIALLPIVMLLFGLGEFTKITMIFFIILFPIVINVRDEVKNIPKEVFYPMYSLGANQFQMIKEIILPGILPAILTSLRLGIGTAISVLFFTENFGTEYGMGYFIMDAWMRINYISMYSGIIILSLLGLTIFIMIDILENILCPWKE
ncbi:MAG: ABC transporter permease [Marinisporobacter sp.]|jgi:NitT/TauT family transport system permease protein|nr:ABC transporter permease [Marinisporobacter sp.]